MPTNPNVPMSRELLKDHWEAYEVGLTGAPTNEERELLLADFLNLIDQARAEGAVEALEKARNALEGFNDGCGCCSDQMAESKIDHLITQYQDGGKE